MTARILIVEDDYFSRFLMQELCGPLGVSAEVAADGQECLDLLHSGGDPFDLILMDIHMPKVSGLEATVAIREDTDPALRKVPIIAVTADRHWHQRDNYEAAGFDSVLPKPVEISELRALLLRSGCQESRSVEEHPSVGVAS